MNPDSRRLISSVDRADGAFRRVKRYLLHRESLTRPRNYEEDELGRRWRAEGDGEREKCRVAGVVAGEFSLNEREFQ